MRSRRCGCRSNPSRCWHPTERSAAPWQDAGRRVATPAARQPVATHGLQIRVELRQRFQPIRWIEMLRQDLRTAANPQRAVADIFQRAGVAGSQQPQVLGIDAEEVFHQGLARWICRASSSLPVPASPSLNSGKGWLAIWHAEDGQQPGSWEWRAEVQARCRACCSMRLCKRYK